MSVEAPSVSIAPVAGPAFSGFNPAEFAPISSISPLVNEGPVSPGFFENASSITENIPKTVETTIPPVFLESFKVPENTPAKGEINFIPVPDLVKEVNQIAFERESPQIKIPPFVDAMQFVEAVQTQDITEKAALEAVREQLREFTAVGISPRVNVVDEKQIALQPNPQTEIQILQVEEAEVSPALKSEQNDTGTQENMEIERFKTVIVEAEEVSRVRELEIGEAGQKAFDEVKVEAEKLGVRVLGMDGNRMKKYLIEHTGNISPIRWGKSGDGSLDQTIREITSGFFKSISEVKDAAKVVIPRNRPAKYAREGNILDENEIAKVEKRHILNLGKSKAVRVITLVKKRIEEIKKTGNTPKITTVIETRKDGVKLEDYPDLAKALAPD